MRISSGDWIGNGESEYILLIAPPERGEAAQVFIKENPPSPLEGEGENGQVMNGTRIRDTIDSSLTRIFMAGPLVSLNGSPTVSPITAAA